MERSLKYKFSGRTVLPFAGDTQRLILIEFGPRAAVLLFTIQTALNLSIMSQCDQNSSDTRWAMLTIESEISVKLFFSLADPFDPYPIGTTSSNR